MAANRRLSVHSLSMARKTTWKTLNEEFTYGVLALLFVGLLTASLAMAYSGAMVITNSGNISIKEITAKSGSPTDIQAAVNTILAYGGGTVNIPAGDWAFDAAPGGAVQIDLKSLRAGATLNIIGAGGSTNTTTQYSEYRTMPTTILRSNISKSITNMAEYCFFSVTGASGKNSPDPTVPEIRFSGISFLGSIGGDLQHGGRCLYFYKVENFRVDHCFLDSTVEADLLAHMCKGLIDHCDFDQTFALHQSGPPETVSWGYGIFVAGDYQLGGSSNWLPLNQLLGKWDTGAPYTAGPVYIENCTFNMCRHAITSAQYSFFCARYNTFQTGRSHGMPYMDVHGSGFPSGRGIEAYNNTIYDYPCFNTRGGGGAVYNNTCVGNDVFCFIWNEGSGPAQEYVHDMWYWSNSLTNVGGIWNVGSPSPVPGTDYFYDSFEGLTSPTSPAPPRPGYTPYQYPHPMATG